MHFFELCVVISHLVGLYLVERLQINPGIENSSKEEGLIVSGFSKRIYL